jgi:hypothetical protein
VTVLKQVFVRALVDSTGGKTISLQAAHVALNIFTDTAGPFSDASIQEKLLDFQISVDKIPGNMERTD